MKQTVLAKRYAKALFVVGKEAGALGGYQEMLDQLALWCRDLPQLGDVLTNPLYPLDIREKALAGVAKAMGADQAMTRFLLLLVQKKRGGLLPEIATEFQRLVDDAAGVSRGTVKVAAPMAADMQKKIQATLEKITGRTVVLSVLEDPGLIGGMIAQVGDLVIDASIRTQLAGLKESIKGSE